MDGPFMRAGNRRTEGHGKKVLVAALVALVSCLVAVAGCWSDVSLKVNGEAISSSEFQFEVDRRIAVAKKNNPSETKGAKGQKLKAETERQVATELIRAVLMEQQAVKLGVKLPADEVTRRLDAERSRVGSDQFDKNLASQGLSLEQYRKTVENQVLVEALGEKVSGNVTVSVDEAESFYLTHKDLFGKSLMAHAAHIVLETEGQADAVASEAKRGADFATLAKTYSRDDATRRNGGDLGWVEKGTTDPALDQVIFSLQPGQVSGVVAASDGFQVVKVMDRREASIPEFSEVADQAVTMLTSRKKEEVFSDWLRTVFANAVVEAGGVGKWDPLLGMVVQK